MADIELRLIANNDDFIQGVKESMNEYQSFTNSVSKGSKEQEQFIAGVVEGIEQEINALNRSEKAVAKTGTSLKSQLRSIKEELSKMEESGLRGTKSFTDLLVKAGQLEDQIGDTQQKVRILASDTKNLDAAMSVSQGLAGGFALAQGAMAVFGNESENLQRQLVKLQGGLNLLNGMQQIANTLNKDSAARVVLAAKAQQFYNVVVGQSTGALKAFRIALAATGIGALIIGLGLLIANWDKVKNAVSNFFSVNEKLSNQIKEQTKLIDTLTEANNEREKSIDRQIALLQAQGDKEEEIYNLQKEKALLGLQLESQEIERTRTRIQLAKEELGERLSINTALKNSGELGAIIAKLFYGTGKKESTVSELNDQLKEQNSAYEDIQNQIKILDTLELKRLKTIRDKAGEKALNDQTKAAEKLAGLLKQLADQEIDAKLSSLTGIDRINAEGELQLKELEILKAHIEKIKPLTKEQQQQLANIRTAINLEADKKRDEFRKNERDKATEQGKKIQELQRKIDEDQLELIGAAEVEKLRLKQRFLIEDIKQLEAKGDKESMLTALNLKQQVGIIENEIEKLSKGDKFSIWKLFGLDPETDEGKAGIEALKETASIIIDEIGKVMEADLRMAEQHTQLVEERLSEAENALNKELALQEKGLANNVDTKRREIEQLKAEREKALEEEKKIQKAQLLLDTATQISSLVTATANLWKGSAQLGPIAGPIAAGIATALMFGSFAAAKIKAFQAINQTEQLEKGGHGDSYGTIKGKRHSSGGERFLDHIEVEEGEKWGVLNRAASSKFGSIFPEMIDSMNRLQFPSMMIKSGNQVINIDTKRMSNKLDSIDTGIRTLNENMSHQTEAFYYGRKRVVKLSKNHTRIINESN